MSSTSPLRVLIVTGIFPPDIGGPATYVSKVASGLVLRGHRITVLTLGDGDHAPNDLAFDVVRVDRRLPRLVRMASAIGHIARLGRQSDVMFVNGLALESAIANAALRKPMVLKIVGDLAWERARARRWVQDGFEPFQVTRHGPRIALLKRLRTWWTRQADRVIVPSAYLKRWVHGWGISEDRIVVVLNAVDRLDRAPPTSSTPSDSTTKLVTVGRLVPWKHVDEVIDAIALLPDTYLVVVGDGPELDGLHMFTERLGVQGRVHFAGRRSHEETVTLMAASDIFVLNSSYEGLPHVVLEAMALGLPVIARAAGGTEEIVRDEDTGLLVGPSHRSLVEALDLMIEDTSLRKGLAERGRRLVQTSFDFCQMVGRTERVLAEACSLPARSPRRPQGDESL